MNTDIRLSIKFLRNPKTVKLKRRLGSDGVLSLISLWLWVAESRPDGDLGETVSNDETKSKMSVEDIEIAAVWDGDSGLFVDTLTNIGFLKLTDHGYEIHDWKDHNPWACDVDKRGNESRLARLAGVNKKLYEELKVKNIKGLTKHQYTGLLNGSLTVSQVSVDGSLTERQPDVKPALSPTPTPAPTPAPAPTPIVLKDLCTEATLLPSVQNDPVVMKIPLISKDGEFDVRQSDINQWSETFPGICVISELREIKQWNIDRPTKRKTKGGIRKHISSWLGNAQNNPRKNNNPVKNFTVRDKVILQNDEISRFLNEQSQSKTIESESGFSNASLLEHTFPGDEVHG
jgi:hypothetical protein